MGAQQSSNAPPVVSTFAAPDPSFTANPTTGVRVTGNVIMEVEERIQKAYLKGKEEGEGSFQSSLEAVAAQVYDNVHQQLSTRAEQQNRTEHRPEQKRRAQAQSRSAENLVMSGERRWW